MLISTVEIRDYKRVREIIITPAADKHLVLLGGKNAQGKSSTIDAITTALEGGKVAPDTVRRGAERATIYIELEGKDGEKLAVERTIVGDKATLTLRNEDGPVRSPQKMLDELIAARFLDPLAFLRLAPKDQRAMLMKVIPDAERIAKLDTKRAGAFDRRTEIGRELEKARGDFARIPEVGEVGTRIDAGEITVEQDRLVAEQRENDRVRAETEERSRNVRDLQATADRTRRTIAELDQQIVELQKRLDQQRSLLKTDEECIASAKAKLAASDEAIEMINTRDNEIGLRLAELKATIRNADDHNRQVYERTAIVKRRDEASAAIAKLEADREACTEAIGKCDERKVELLAKAPLPVPGLAFTDEGITLNGVALAQASGAEKMRVALALAIAAAPELDDVWVKDAAILDDDSIALVEQLARAAKKRVWLEIVGNRGEGTIEIRDGEVARG